MNDPSLFEMVPVTLQVKRQVLAMQIASPGGQSKF